MNEINKNTYNDIAYEFSNTRAYTWKCVKDFANLIKMNEILNPFILEIGCGNGKNMDYLERILDDSKNYIIGIDNCENFIEICNKKNLSVVHSESECMPFKDNIFDYILCIAMFHHLLTAEERDATFKEILRVMKPGAIGILTCWSTTQPENIHFKFNEGINVVPWKGRQINNKIRYYYVYSEKMFREYFESFEEIKIINIYYEFGNWVLIFQNGGTKVPP